MAAPTVAQYPKPQRKMTELQALFDAKLEDQSAVRVISLFKKDIPGEAKDLEHLQELYFNLTLPIDSSPEAERLQDVRESPIWDTIQKAGVEALNLNFKRVCSLKVVNEAANQLREREVAIREVKIVNYSYKEAIYNPHGVVKVSVLKFDGLIVRNEESLIEFFKGLERMFDFETVFLRNLSVGHSKSNLSLLSQAKGVEITQPKDGEEDANIKIMGEMKKKDKEQLKKNWAKLLMKKREVS